MASEGRGGGRSLAARVGGCEEACLRCLPALAEAALVHGAGVEGEEGGGGETPLSRLVVTAIRCELQVKREKRTSWTRTSAAALRWCTLANKCDFTFRM
jgi:hypothetical protein